MGEQPHQRAQRIAAHARDEAIKLGAKHVIVLIGEDDGSHHIAWSGTGLGIRGLFEVCADIIRRTFISPSVVLGAGGGGTGSVQGTGSNAGGGGAGGTHAER